MSVRIFVGDVRAQLQALPENHFDCVVTSPPYWGLRDYEADGQIGLESTLAEHLAVMVEVCREIRRVLKPTGTFWLNYGDCYANDGKWGGETGGKQAYLNDGSRKRNGREKRQTGLKPKDLCMIPQRLALALQEDGWWVRSLLPWVKRNGMPESITDRPAGAVEYVIFLTKSARYTYDADAVRRPASPSTNARVSQDVAAQAGSMRANGGAKTNGPMKAVVRKPGVGPKSAAENTNIKAKDSWHASTTEVLADRNFRNSDLFFDSLQAPFGLISAGDVPVALDVCPEGFKEAHFATFPPKLVEPLLRAGCPKGGRVLDPFGGSGTVGLVAARLGFDCTLIELNPKYAAIADRRLRAGLAQVDGQPAADDDLPPLFAGAAA